MPGNLTQDGRIGTLTTPLGEDKLVLSRFEGSEAMGELFEYRIEAVSEQENIDFNQALGLNCAVTIKTIDQLERNFNGVLVQARWTGVKNDLYVYQLVLRPWLWLLSRTSDCRIFSSMKVPDIIEKVFNDRGFPDFRKALTGSYPTLEYCVQYRESDMNFVCRLMEEYGIYYFYEHTKDKHTLVLADSKSSHKSIPGLSSVPFLPGHGEIRRDKQQFDDWSTFRGFQSGRFVLNDYDYEKPGANLIADADKSGGYAHGSRPASPETSAAPRSVPRPRYFLAARFPWKAIRRVRKISNISRCAPRIPMSIRTIGRAPPPPAPMSALMKWRPAIASFARRC